MLLGQYDEEVAEVNRYRDELEQKNVELQRVMVEKVEMEKKLIKAEALLEGMERGKQEMMRMMREQGRMAKEKLRRMEEQFQLKMKEEREQMQGEIQLQKKQVMQLNNKTEQLTEEIQMVKEQGQQAEEEVVVVRKEIDNGKQVAVMKGIERLVDEVQWGENNHNQRQPEEEADQLEWQQINNRIHRKLKHLKQKVNRMRMEMIERKQEHRNNREVAIFRGNLSLRHLSFRLFLYSAMGRTRSAIVDGYYNAFVENELNDCDTLMEIGDTEMSVLTDTCGMTIIHAKRLFKKIKELKTDNDGLKQWIMNVMAENGVFTMTMLTKRISMMEFERLLNNALAYQ